MCLLGSHDINLSTVPEMETSQLLNEWMDDLRPVKYVVMFIFNVVKLRQGSAREGKRLKASKLKALPKAYTKVGCHLPNTTTRKSQYTRLMA